LSVLCPAASPTYNFVTSYWQQVNNYGRHPPKSRDRSKGEAQTGSEIISERNS
jgi:hypothetical protein